MTSPEEVHNQRDNGEQQQKVDQTARHVKREPPAQPNHEKNHKQHQEHESLLF
jgi:hypothetical protein